MHTRALKKNQYSKNLNLNLNGLKNKILIPKISLKFLAYFSRYFLNLFKTCLNY